MKSRRAAHVLVLVLSPVRPRLIVLIIIIAQIVGVVSRETMRNVMQLF